MGHYLSAWNIFLTIFGLNCLGELTDFGNKGKRYGIVKWKLLPPSIIMTLLLYLIYRMTSETSIHRDNLGFTMVTGYLQLSCAVIPTITIFFSLINSKGYANLKSTFVNYDHAIKVEYETVKRGIKKYIVFLLTIYAMSFATDYLVYSFQPSGTNWLNLISSYIFQLYNMLSVLQFSVCLFWLRATFHLINDDIQNRSKLFLPLKKSVFLDVFNNIVVEDKPTDTFIQFRTKEILSGLQAEIGAVELLRLLRSLYHSSHKLSQNVNDVFASRNLLTVGHNFVLGTVHTYFAIAGLVHVSNGERSVTSIELLSDFKWCLICFLSIYSLIWPSTITHNEAKKIGHVVQELLTQPIINEDLRRELYVFASQLVEEEVVFSPHGFFVLNNALLLSIMSAVVSYLIILIQFRIPVTE